MGRGTWKNFELILLFRGVGEGWGWFVISRFRGSPEKRHETRQNNKTGENGLWISPLIRWNKSPFLLFRIVSKYPSNLFGFSRPFTLDRTKNSPS